MRYINKSRLLALFAAITILFACLVSYAENIGNDIADSVVRLHIIANSDSEYDQAIKIAVRDRLMSEKDKIFGSSQSAAEALRFAKQSADLIKQIAEDELMLRGCPMNVKVKIGTFAFPTKVYDGIMLPAGKYSAVRVEIGEAVGKNWWCVMYPPLCLTDGVLSASDSSLNELKSSLTDSEYRLVTGTGGGAIPVEVKFKLVEVVRQLF